MAILAAIPIFTKSWWTLKNSIKFAICAVIIGTSGYFVYQHFSEFRQRGKQVAQLTEKIGAVEGERDKARESAAAFEAQVGRIGESMADLATAVSDIQNAQAVEAQRTSAALSLLHSQERREKELSMRANAVQAETLLSTYNAQVACYNKHLGQTDSPCSIGDLNASP